MSEHDVVNSTAKMPATIESIQADLESIGVRKGMVLLVHSSLSSLGWVCGGPVAVVIALEKTLGPEGTLVMPSYSSDLSEPSYWVAPPVPENWWPVIREHMPAFDPRLTPTSRVGAIPECFRSQRGVKRSAHPCDSFAARGMHADSIVGSHPLDFSMGNDGPLARIYNLDGWVLLLGTTYSCASSIHLAEFRAKYPSKKEMSQGAPILVKGKRIWTAFKDFETNESDFPRIGAEFESETRFVRAGRVANATARLFPQRQFVDYAVKWMERNRQ